MHSAAALRGALARTLALVLAALICAGSVDWGHTGWDDPGCDPVPVHHDHSAHRLARQTQPDAPTDGHCYLCHALRLLHVALAAHPIAAAQNVATSPYCTDVPVGLSQAAAGALLPRAPPTALV